jgi:hypothetical protein
VNEGLLAVPGLLGVDDGTNAKRGKRYAFSKDARIVWIKQQHSYCTVLERLMMRASI